MWLEIFTKSSYQAIRARLIFPLNVKCSKGAFIIYGGGGRGGGGGFRQNW